MRFLRQTLTVAWKDLLVEWRSPSRLSGLFFFGFGLLLAVAFASNTTDVMRRQAGGVLWIGLLLASTRAFDQSYASELEEGALEGLTLWPVRPLAIYYGKALANLTILVLVALGLTPLVFAMFDAPLRGEPLDLLAYLGLGCAALAAPGTLFGLMAASARGGSVLLPLLLFPLVMPSMLAAARGTTLVMEGDPMGQGVALIAILVAVNLLHWSVAGLLFSRVVEDG